MGAAAHTRVAVAGGTDGWSERDETIPAILASSFDRPAKQVN